MKSHDEIPTFIVTLCILSLLGLMLCGCESLPETRGTVERIRMDVVELQRRATTMPAADRALIEKNAEAVNRTLATAEAALRTLETGDPTGLAPLTENVPYAGLGLAVLTILVREYKLRQVNRALQQTVAPLEGTLTDAQKAALAAAQDEKTKAIVWENRPETPANPTPGG